MATGRLIPLLALAILLLVGAAAGSEAFETSAEKRTIDENFSPSPGVIELEHSNLANVSYVEQVRVRSNVTAGGEEEILVVEGTDYLWHSNNGTIEVLSGSRLSDGGDANVTYAYYAQSSFQRDMANISATLFEIAPLLVLIGIVGVVVVAARGFD